MYSEANSNTTNRPVDTLQPSSGTAPPDASVPVPLPPKENAKIDHGAESEKYRISLFFLCPSAHKRHRPLNNPSGRPPAASGENAVVQPLADSERCILVSAVSTVLWDDKSYRLISTLQDCFANLLKEQKEQTNRYINL
jgi:hypothetical protein